MARQASNDILDRGGYPKTSRQETEQNSTLIIENDQADLIKLALSEIVEPLTQEHKADLTDPIPKE